MISITGMLAGSWRACTGMLAWPRGFIQAAQQLALNYANRSFVRPDGERAGFDIAKELKEDGFFGAQGQATVAIVSGKQPGLVGATDTIKVRVLE